MFWLQNNINHLLISQEVIYSGKLLNIYYLTSHMKNKWSTFKVTNSEQDFSDYEIDFDEQ